MAAPRDDASTVTIARNDLPVRMLQNIAAARQHTPAVIDRRLASAACSMPNWLIRVAHR